MYSLQGKVSLTLLDKNGTVKKTKCKHNTITALGKMAALTNGVANLTDYCNLYGASVAKPHETGDTGTTKSATSVVKIVLTNKAAASFEGKSFESLEDSDIIGFATSATEITDVAKEGIRVSARNEQLDVLVANQTRDGVRFSWTGIEGNLNTVCMFIPPLAVMQCCDNTDTTAAQYTKLSTQFITTGDGSVPADCIAIGPSLTKLLNLKTLTLSDFVPSTRAVPATDFGRCAFYFGDYTITFCPSLSRIVTVYNAKTGAYYTVDASSSLSSLTHIPGFIIKNNELYMIGQIRSSTAAAYKVTVTDSVMTFTSYTDLYNIINASWIDIMPSGYRENKWSFVPVQIGNEMYTYCIDSCVGGSSVQNDCFIIKDMQAQSPDNKYIAPYVLCSKNPGNVSSVGGVYLNTIYCIDSKGLYVAPVGQYGNLFSYFDLGETWEIASTDTLQLSYFYELEDRL